VPGLITGTPGPPQRQRDDGPVASPGIETSITDRIGYAAELDRARGRHRRQRFPGTVTVTIAHRVLSLS
jgi:hypothetical protein